ncbi:G-protein coupled receptor 54 [Exaiptasia diaphana]|nr:G-protein coupled receptor 54 [Exaiptasia diaphana]
MNESNAHQVSSLCVKNTHLFEISKFAVIAILAAIGIAGNTFIIILAAKYTERKSLHCLIINMAVSDIVFVIMHILRDVVIYRLTNPPQILADYFCKIVLFLENTSELVTLTTLLIERGKCYQDMHSKQKDLNVKQKTQGSDTTSEVEFSRSPQGTRKYKFT